MIKNERQYRITKAQAERFRQGLLEVRKEEDKESVHPLLRKAQEDAIRSQYEELRKDLDEYEALRSGKLSVLELDSFDDFPRALIQARIAVGLSQKELAQRLGLKEQQIQRYEANDYANATLERVRRVVEALGMNVKETVRLPQVRAST